VKRENQTENLLIILAAKCFIKKFSFQVLKIKKSDYQQIRFIKKIFKSKKIKKKKLLAKIKSNIKGNIL